MLSPGPFFLAQICTKLFSGCGFAQTLIYWGSSERSPNPLAGKGRGKEGKGREQEVDGREARGVCLLLNFSLDMRAFGLRVIFVNVRGAGIYASLVFLILKLLQSPTLVTPSNCPRPQTS